MKPSSIAVLRLLVLLLPGGCAGRCGARGGLPPEPPPRVVGSDGQPYYVEKRGPYSAFYDPSGRLRRLERDTNGDGRPDEIAHHEGTRTPRAMEVDEDFDGRIDRWEEYDATGRLRKTGRSRGGDRPITWTVYDPEGRPVRREHDEDQDGRVDRAELLREGRTVRVEIDADRDGRFDRWQDWTSGRLVSEELDTDGDGRPDRRLRYGEGGRLLPLETLAPR